MTDDHKKMLKTLIDEVKDLKKSMKDLYMRHATIEELGHLSIRLLNDLSAKKDLELCSMGVKNTSKKNTSSDTQIVDSKKMNIMAYFKYKYKENPASLYDIIDEKEMSFTLEKNKTELKSKKKTDLAAAEASILYKAFINGNKTNQNRLRSKKDKEEEEAVVHKKELIENEANNKYDNENDEENYNEDDESDDED